jgi:sugar phosphate isomerase/epimerase
MDAIRFFCPRWGSEALAWQTFMDKVKEEGYDGVEVAVPGHMTTAELEQISEMAARRGLAWIAQHYDTVQAGFTEHYGQYAAWLDKVAPLAPLFINSQTGRDFFSFEQNRALLTLAETKAAAYGVRIVHETHRGKFSFAAHTTRPFLEAMPGLRLTLDASHWVCVSETLLEDQRDTMELAISRTDHIHARVGQPESPQIGDPRAPENLTMLDAHLAWWDAVAAQQRDGPLTITPEFGPPPYMATIPFSGEPVTSQWEANAFMMRLLRNRYLSMPPDGGVLHCKMTKK